MTLRRYLKLLESQGELHRVPVEVDPELELGEIAMRQAQLGGPALLFERVQGSAFPVVINLNATRRRLELGLGREPGRLGSELARMLQDLRPPLLRNLWRHRQTLRRSLAMRSRRVRRSPAQAVRHLPGDLSKLPTLQCWPKDGGRFLTLPLVQTADPETGRTNLGVYRMQIFGPRQAGMHWQIVRGGEAHAANAQALGLDRLPCAAALGGDPALILAAIFPLPEGMEELPFSGLLRGHPQELVRALTQPLWVPADAEFLLEGWVELKELRREGPFGDHFGHYSQAAPYPVFKLSALTHRPDAIYPATIVGKPPQEDRVWGEAINEFSAPFLKLMHPEISDFWTYYEAGFHNLLVVALRQRHRKEGVKTALGLLGTGQLSLSKVVVLVDAGVDPRDFAAVLREARRHFDASEDVLLLPGTPLDTLDFSSYVMNLGSKLVLDCSSTRGLKLAPSGPLGRKWEPDSLRRVLGRAYLEHASLEGALLLIKVRQQGHNARHLLRACLDKAKLGKHKWLALVSADVDLQDPIARIWGVFTRFDAARDVLFGKSWLDGAWPRHQGVLGIDATFKRGYPEPLEMSPSVKKKVDARWREYGFQ